MFKKPVLCKGCNRVLPVTAFGTVQKTAPNGKRYDFRRYLCKECTSAEVAEKSIKQYDNRPIRHCAFCNSVLPAKNTKKIYCSNSCNARAYYERNKKKILSIIQAKRDQNHPQKKYVSCVVCGNETINPKSKYCSRKCKSKKYIADNIDRLRIKWKSENASAIAKSYRKKYRKSEAGKLCAKKSKQKYLKTEHGKNLQRLWNKANKERHPELRKKHNALYKERHPDRFAQQRANERQARRSREASAPANFTTADWRAALEYFDNKCAYCGDPLDVPHREHFIALSNGGGFTKDNIVPACGRCNSRKGNKNPLDWLVMQAHGLAAYLRVKQYLESA